MWNLFFHLVSCSILKGLCQTGHLTFQGNFYKIRPDQAFRFLFWSWNQPCFDVRTIQKVPVTTLPLTAMQWCFETRQWSYRGNVPPSSLALHPSSCCCCCLLNHRSKQPKGIPNIPCSSGGRRRRRTSQNPHIRMARWGGRESFIYDIHKHIRERRRKVLRSEQQCNGDIVNSQLHILHHFIIKWVNLFGWAHFVTFMNPLPSSLWTSHMEVPWREPPLHPLPKRFTMIGWCCLRGWELTLFPVALLFGLRHFSSLLSNLLLAQTESVILSSLFYASPFYPFVWKRNEEDDDGGGNVTIKR